MQDKIPITKDAFTVRMKPDLYDKMREKLKSYRKGRSINKYINNLIENDLLGVKTNEKK